MYFGVCVCVFGVCVFECVFLACVFVCAFRVCFCVCVFFVCVCVFLVCFFGVCGSGCDVRASRHFVSLEPGRSVAASAMNRTFSSLV